MCSSLYFHSYVSELGYLFRFGIYQFIIIVFLDEPYDVDKIGSALVGLSTLSNPLILTKGTVEPDLTSV